MFHVDLLQAALAGRKDTVQFLLKNGAKRDAKLCAKLTAEMCTRTRDFMDIAALCAPENLNESDSDT